MWNFKAKLNRQHVEFYKDGLSYSVCSITEINWGVEPELRDWGVKSINIFVPDQEVTIVYDLEDKDGNTTEEEITFMMQDVKIEHVPLSDGFWDQICMQSLMIDLDHKKVTAEF